MMEAPELSAVPIDLEDLRLPTVSRVGPWLLAIDLALRQAGYGERIYRWLRWLRRTVWRYSHDPAVIGHLRESYMRMRVHAARDKLEAPRNYQQRYSSRGLPGDLRTAGVQVQVPEIADYELRGELIRVNRQRGIAYLDRLETTGGYVPLTTAAVRRAAALWAQARQLGTPTAPDLALVLAVQEADEVVIATTNPGHLQRYAPAEEWEE
jgi:hypothetical protein